MDKISEIIADELGVKKSQVDSTIKLIDDGNTIPFIARYRKEATGGLSDEQLRNLGERLTYLRNLEERKQEVIKSIDSQGKLTDEIVKSLKQSKTLADVEDIYRPYKQKKRTRATIAKEKGLDELAKIILGQDSSVDIDEVAKSFINEEKGVNAEEDARSGALDIIAEAISDEPKYRKQIKQICYREGFITTKAAKPEEKSSYEMYYDFAEKVNRIPSHRILAINRGEKEEFLKVKIEKPTEKILELIENDIIKDRNSQYVNLLTACVEDSFSRLIEPSIDREIRSDLTEKAEEQAIKVFGKNAKQLLLTSPIKGKTVIGFDPAYRTGCKIAVIDETGKVLDTTTVYPTEPQNDVEGAKKELTKLIAKYNVDMFAIGNGTASRESEQFVSDLIAEIKEKYNKDLVYVIVSEAGASVYSASKLAIDELPDLDVTIRGAVSIARRVQDPLAESVKIDPKSIGVGQYQHDVNQKQLTHTLDQVVESVVNHVGVELNTASPAILQHIAGISGTVAKNIVAFRQENGGFTSRKQLLKVPRLGPAAFTQCAGFLRLNGAKNPLDNTSVHPESYELAERIIGELGFTLKDLQDKSQLEALQVKLPLVDVDKMAHKLDAGIPTVRDIIAALAKPGRDPREDLPAPLTRKHVVSLEDIKVGTVVKGTVHNVVDFGAFIDFGLKTNGLLHRSELCTAKQHPSDVLAVGDIIEAEIISVDVKRNRIGLSVKSLRNKDKKKA